MFLGSKLSRLNFKREDAILTMLQQEPTGKRWRTCHLSLQRTNERKDQGIESDREGGKNKRETRLEGDRVSERDGKDWKER
jgi:hypothetical protein